MSATSLVLAGLSGVLMFGATGAQWHQGRFWVLGLALLVANLAGRFDGPPRGAVEPSYAELEARARVAQLQNELDSARTAITHMQSRVDQGLSNHS